jgi:hypothetical protein
MGSMALTVWDMQVNELSVNSYLKEVQAYSFGACVSYDAAQAIDKEAERLDELAGALYRYAPMTLRSGSGLCCWSPLSGSSRGAGMCTSATST